ncbi:MAG: hypothetical protein ACLFQE_08010 [Thermotogota bacterium]
MFNHILCKRLSIITMAVVVNFSLSSSEENTDYVGLIPKKNVRCSLSINNEEVTIKYGPNRDCTWEGIYASENDSAKIFTAKGTNGYNGKCDLIIRLEIGPEYGTDSVLVKSFLEGMGKKESEIESFVLKRKSVK